MAKMNHRTKDNAVGVFLLHLFASTQCVYWMVGLQQQHSVAAFSPQRPFQNHPAVSSNVARTWPHSHGVLASSYYPTKTSIFSSSDSVVTGANVFDDKQKDFTMGYLNKHHGNLLAAFASAFTELGTIQSKKNAFTGGSYKIEDSTIVDFDPDSITMDVTVKIRSKEPTTERVTFPLDAYPVEGKQRQFKAQPLIPLADESVNPVDDFMRRVCRLCHIVGRPGDTGKVIQLGIQIGGAGVGDLKENMYLNQVPHNRYVRKYFYDMAANATLDAVIQCSNGELSNRMIMTAMFPEMNTQMDSYRIGTLLELTRSVAIKLAEQNLRVRVCVQGSMGVGIFTGVPKTLSGVSTLLQRMDWQSEEGEENEGLVGNFVNFGAVGKEHVVNAHIDSDGNPVEQDDVFLLVCPQNMLGLECSIMPTLSEMVEAAGDRPIIIINPDLVDKVSAQGQQSVRGRQDRLDFAASFQTIFHFQNIYYSGTSYFPILGAITKFGPKLQWVAHQRRDRINNDGEVYVPALASESQPDGELIMEAFN
eukprot:scaffold15258_cov49-Attheya_sp.AAC.5